MGSFGSYTGIDVSKDMLDVAVLSGDGEVRSFRLSNDAAGHQQLLELTDPSTQVIVEATGVYHRQLHKRLTDAGVALSVVNPRQALSYAKSKQRRNKTDKVDAVLLAQFGRERELPLSPQLAPAQQSLARELAALKEDLRRLRNRLEAAEHGLSHPEVPSSLKRRISTLEEEQKVLEKQLPAQAKLSRTA
jgi:transposase